MLHLPDVLLGAALVAIGMFAAALADRFRGIRLMGARVARPCDRHPGADESRLEPAEVVPGRRPAAKRASRSESGVTPEGDDVIAALVTAGYKRSAAADAVWGCCASERATIEGWARAALRRATGAVS